MENNSVETKLPKIKHRKRTRLLRKTVLSQIEFFFGERNIQHNKHFQQLLAENPDGIDISVVLSFNSLRNLSVDVDFVRRLLKDSQVVEVTEDNKLKPKRTVSTQPEPDDDCCCFVDNIPEYLGVDWLKKIFGKFGQINFISLPRTKGVHMGFAFVEFATPEQCCKAREAFGRKTAAKKNSRKRHHSDDVDLPDAKRTKTETPEVLPTSSTEPQEPIVSTPLNTTAATANAEKKKKRQRHRRRRIKSSRSTFDHDVSSLTVLLHKEWQQQKRMYKSLQRQNFAELKKLLQANAVKADSTGASMAAVGKSHRRGQSKLLDRANSILEHNCAALMDSS